MEMPPSERQAQRSCDRCFKHKRRCCFESSNKTCTPCKESGVACSTLRSQPRKGRPPKGMSLGPQSRIEVWEVSHPSSASPTQHSPINGHVFSESLGLSPSLPQTTPAPSPSTSDIMNLPQPLQNDLYLTSPEIIKKFSKELDLFMLGPSFAAEFRAAIQQSFFCSPALLRNIFRAIVPLSAKTAKNRSWAEAEIETGATALEQLRTARIVDKYDALAIVTLGQTLAALDLLTTCRNPSLILRYSLLSSQPWYEDLSSEACFDPLTIPSILWDTVDCLIKREVPVVKYVSRGLPVVDRMAGLCTTLLPTFYDLCVAGRTLKEQKLPDSSPDTHIVKRLEQQLVLWTPAPPLGFSHAFSEFEVSQMQTQASMYRTAGLLLAHRLISPIGNLDDIASIYAEDIARHLSAWLTSNPTKNIHNVAFPVLVAALELPNLPKNTFENVTLWPKAPLCLGKVVALVDYVWRHRHSGYSGNLFDLIDTGPDVILIP